jgi:hypothetical protein
MGEQPIDSPEDADQNRLKRQRAERILEAVSVILLSLTTMVTAWSAYQASRWGTTMSTEPQSNPDAPKSPFSMPEYGVSQAEEAARLDEEAGTIYNEAMAANTRRDGHALLTVLLASVLFFVGISSRLKWFPLQVIMVSIGAMVFLAVVFRLTAFMLS